MPPSVAPTTTETVPIAAHAETLARPGALNMQTQRPKVNVPTHPIKCMQGPFAESMQEAAEATAEAPKSRPLSSEARRKRLLDQDLAEETHAARWKQKPGQEHHQLWKLIAQVSFGIYLLLHGLAKDEQQVLAILQKHVDEIDEFLETTIDDFDLAQKDIEERLKFLQLPLENMDIFDAMLQDATFRNQIVTGNERIEHIINRTATAMKDALEDVGQGLAATREFADYLAQEEEHNTSHKARRDMRRVYDAMRGNTNGWQKAFTSLQVKGKALAASLAHLGTIVAEMDKRAEEIRASLTATPLSPAQSPKTSPRTRKSLTHELKAEPAEVSPRTSIAVVHPAQIYSPPATVYEDEDSHEDAHDDAVGEDEAPIFLKPYTYSPLPSPAASPDMGRLQGPDQSQDSPKVSERPSQSSLNAGRPAMARHGSRDLLRDTLEPKRNVADEQSQLRMARQESQNVRATASPDHARHFSNEKRHEVARKGSRDLLNDRSRGTSRDADARHLPRQGSRDLLREARSPHDAHREPVRITSLAPGPQIDTAREFRRVSPRTVDVSRPANTPEEEPSLSRRTSMREKFNMRCKEVESDPRITLPPVAREHSPVLLESPAFPEPPQAPSSAHGEPAYLSPSSRGTPQSPAGSYFTLPTRPQFGPGSFTPRSDQQFFRPVPVNPNSPLQRPWTATTAPVHGRATPSAMSMMSSATPNGSKLKKKKSGFGWLKKAFSLSEEERAAFEARRHTPDERYHDQRPAPRFLDGKRLDSPRQMR